MRQLYSFAIIMLLAACTATIPSLGYPIILVDPALEERATELIENPMPVVQPFIQVHVHERQIQYQGFKADRVDIFDKVTVDIDLQQLCLADGTIGEAQQYVLDHISITLSGELIQEIGSSLFIENPTGNNYRTMRCTTQDNLIMTVTAFIKLTPGIHLGEITLMLRDSSILHYEFGFATSEGVLFGA